MYPVQKPPPMRLNGFWRVIQNSSDTTGSRVIVINPAGSSRVGIKNGFQETTIFFSIANVTFCVRTHGNYSGKHQMVICCNVIA